MKFLKSRFVNNSSIYISQLDRIIIMTTYIICKNKKCGHKFKSPIQVANLESEKIEIQNVVISCPKCGQEMIIEKRDLFNE